MADPQRLTMVSGRKVDVLDLQETDVDIADIAHSLSLTNRYNGNTRHPTNVARHSLVVAQLVSHATDDPVVVAAALMHDAAEAYIGDMIRPLKHLMPRFIQIEAAIEFVIDTVFAIHVDTEARRLIKEADIAASLWEQRDLVQGGGEAPHSAGANRFMIPAVTYPTNKPETDRMDLLHSAARLTPVPKLAAAANAALEYAQPKTPPSIDHKTLPGINQFGVDTLDCASCGKDIYDQTTGCKHCVAWPINNRHDMKENR